MDNFRALRRTGQCVGLSLLISSAWAAPLPPQDLIPEIQHEFTRLYDLPDDMLQSQVEPALEIFPEYREQLMTYLAQGASPRRREILTNMAEQTDEKLATWFKSTQGKVIVSATIVGAAAVAFGNHSGSGGGHKTPARQPAPAPEVPPPPAEENPPAEEPPPVVTPPVVTPPPVNPPPVVTPPEEETPPEVTPPETPPPETTPPETTPDPDPTNPPEEPEEPEEPEQPEEPAPEPIPPPTREELRTEEFKRTVALNAIHADYAYERGGTGKGVVISVQDADDVNTSHSELVNQLAPGADLGGVDGHGTAVARTAVGERNDTGYHGVAYDAMLLTHVGRTNDQVVDREIAYGARISNHSYFVPTGDGNAFAESNKNTYLKGVRAGIIYVWAAGNDKGEADPKEGYATMPLYVPELEGHWLTVVAVNLNPDLTGRADGSSNGNSSATDIQGNACGKTADFCIAAPGFGFQNVTPTQGGYSYGYTSGSSLAAPTVSGALAVLMDLFPTLTSEQIVARVKASANKTGIYADKSIYGNGLLDLQAASAPIGALMVETTTGEIVALSQASIAEGSAMGNAIRTSLSKVNLVLKDSLDAPFLQSGSTLASNMTAEPSRIDTGKYLQRFERDNQMQDMSNDSGLQLRFSGGTEGTGLDALGEVQAWQSIGKEMKVSAGFNTDPSFSQGLQATHKELQGASVTQAFSNPYLSLDEQASGAGMHWDMGNNWQGGVQVQSSKSQERFDRRGNGTQQNSVQGEWGYAASNGFTANVQVGVLNEDQRMLGSQSRALVGDGTTRTSFTGFNLSMPINEQWRVYGRYNTGFTKLSGNGWLEGSNLRSDSMALGVIGQPSSQWQVGAIAYQPLRVSDGKLSANLPTGLNADNSVAWNKVNLDMNAQGKHMEYETFFRYQMPVWNIRFKGSLLRIQDYNNEAGNDDTLLMLNANLPY